MSKVFSRLVYNLPRLHKPKVYSSVDKKYWILWVEDTQYYHLTWDDAIRTFNKIRFERITK